VKRVYARYASGTRTADWVKKAWRTESVLLTGWKADRDGIPD
jgi:hypothetical protein